MGAVLGAVAPFVGKALFGGAVTYGIGKALSRSNPQPPPPITSLPNQQELANQFRPINFTRIMDELSGDKLQIVRELDGKIALNFGNAKNRINLNDAGDIRLPAVRQIRGNNITERASEVIALSAAMTRLGNAIEQMESTSPYLIPQNQELINSYKTAVKGALDRGFDFKQQAIDQRLIKMGLANSSTAIGAQIALAREKATAYAEAELKQSQLAQDLKQQAILNLTNRGQLLNAQANTELNRFATETSNQLQAREQNMKADLATQSLEQQRALEQARLGLLKSEQIDRRRANMLGIATDLFNSGNQQSLGAQQLSNNAIANANQAQYQRYSMRSDPMGDMFKTFGGSFIGSMGDKFGSQLFEKKPEKRAPWLPTPIDF